ncbi:hypothetical protein CFBP4996_19970 [Agrobacterium leguminum]|nr:MULTISPECIES: hypothetical protein [Agrobacterium]WFS68294.1 hypothetical protein CFBP4996_19970 [Agrobacterium leguminum]
MTETAPAVEPARVGAAEPTQFSRLRQNRLRGDHIKHHEQEG